MSVLITLLALALGPEPSVVARSFEAEVRGSSTFSLDWEHPDRFALRPRTSGLRAEQPIVERGGTVYYGVFPGPEPGVGEVQRRAFPARPDAYSVPQSRLTVPTEFVLAEARAGKLRLRSARVGGRRALHGRVALRPNKCAALPSGSAEVWLDPQTLLPLQIVFRRARMSADLRISYRSVNRAVPASLFAPPPLGQRPLRRDLGFRRTSPRAAAEQLSYIPELPTELPEGFELAVSGWARRSGQTGPEASNPPYRELFAAVYRRGFERIDVTQRLAGAKGWISDPFGVECGFQLEAAVQLGAVRASYGAGPEITPHVYWRRGRVLYTVSGPLPRAELVALARSLAAVS